MSSQNPLGYTGINLTQQPEFINAQRAPTAVDYYTPGTRWQNNSVSPPIIYETTGGGAWNTEGQNHATTTTYGTVILTDDNEPVATQFYVDSIAIAGAPVATETTAGIGELATDAEAIAGTPSTGLLALFVTPSNLAPVFGSPPAIGGTIAASGAFTGLTADGTGLVTLASSGDVTLSTATGSFVVSAGESATDAVKIESTAGGVQILASGASAGEDIVLTATGSSVRLTATESAVDSINIESTAGGIKILASGASAGEDIVLTATGSSIRLTATESATDSINIESTLGGINILASGASAGEDINITATGSSVNVSSTENAALAIYLHADGGASETIRLRADQGTGTASIDLLSDVGGITLTGGLGTADAINIVASDTAGGIDIDAGTGGIAADTTGTATVTSTADSANAIYLHANGGTSETIKIHSDQGTGVASVNILSDVGGITIQGGLGTADAINIVASAAAGGIDIDAGTNGFIVDTTGAFSIDGAAASNVTVTGAFDLTINTTAGSLNLSAGEAAADAINVDAAAGGLDVDVALQMNLDSSQAAADAVRIRASNAGGGIDVDAGTGGITIDTTGALSLDSAAASNFTVTGAFDLSLISTLGSVNVTAGEDAADAIVLSAGAGGIDILATGAAGQDIDIVNTGGSVNITATESAADSVVITSTAGGIDILASGAAAGEDIDIVATGSSINITATENVTDAVNITASGAAARLTLTAGTGSIKIASGLIVNHTSLTNASTPYTVLGTDYFLDCDTSGGVLTVTLPAATAVAGRTYVIRDVGGAAGVNNITIGGGGTNLVGGGAAAASKTLSAAYSGATVYSNGTVWAYSYVA